MLQGFVYLGDVSRTEQSVKSLLQKLSEASYTKPTKCYSNVNPVIRSYPDETLLAEAKYGADWIALCGNDPYMFHCTILLPREDREPVMFLRFENERALDDAPPINSLINFAKTLSEELSPRLMRLGDSVAREKLKSHHGLILLPDCWCGEVYAIKTAALIEDGCLWRVKIFG